MDIGSAILASAPTSTLEILKLAGLAIGSAASIWGLTRKTTFEDAHGDKRLTPAGHVALALALGSFLVAAASQGFEVLQKQARKTAEASEKAAAEARALRNERTLQRTHDLALFSRLEQQAQATEQRLRDIQFAQEARSRDLALALNVNRGSARNLRRTGEAIGQIERLLSPIGTPAILMSWQIPIDSVAPQIAEEVRRSGYYTRDIARESLLRFPELFSAANSPASATFFAAGRDVDRALSEFGLHAGDLRFSMGEPHIQYSTISRALVMSFRIESANFIVNSGRIVSLQDLEASTFVLFIGGAIVVPMIEGRRVAVDEERVQTILASAKPTGLYIRANGQAFQASGRELRRVVFNGTPPMYVGRVTRERVEALD